MKIQMVALEAVFDKMTVNSACELNKRFASIALFSELCDGKNRNDYETKYCEIF